MIESFLSFWNSREEFRDFITRHPILGSLAFIAIQALQVVLAPLPGEVTGFLAGFLFGAFKGFFLSMTGLIIGSFIAFSLARYFRKRFFKKYENTERYRKIRRIFKKHGLTGMFLLYLFPGFPKDFLNYFLGFMPVSKRGFIVVCTLGRIPGTFALAIQGDVVYQGHPLKIGIVSLAFLVVFLVFFWVKKKLYGWFEENSTI